MDIIFNGSIFLLVSLQLNFALVQSRTLETKEPDPYFTTRKDNSTNLFPDTGTAVMKTNKTDIPLKGMHEKANMISNQRLHDKDQQENKISNHGQRPSRMDESDPKTHIERMQNRENSTEEGSYTSSSAKYSSMDSSQKSYRTVNSALRNGESWPWGKAGRQSFSNDESNNLSTGMNEEKYTSNNAHSTYKNQLSKLTIFLSLFYISIGHIRSLV